MISVDDNDELLVEEEEHIDLSVSDHVTTVTVHGSLIKCFN